MIWKDTHLCSGFCLPKQLYYVTACNFFIIAYLAGSCVITSANIMDKIIGSIGTIFLVYYGLCNIFMIIKGSEYVEVIKKEKDCFILTNVYRKKIKFTVSDVLSVKTSKFSFIDKFLTGFAKYEPGLDLFLKDGSKYNIASDMENIDSLKEHLLGNEIPSDHD